MEPQKRARKKYLSAQLARELIPLKSSLHKAYRNTLACCHEMEVTNANELRSLYYCRRRWCSTCASINMATLINKYEPIIRELPDLHFVTLTIPNCRSSEIEQKMDEMAAAWRQIADNARKQHRRFRGLRKIELKVGKGGGFHPHYHLIVEGAENGQWIIEEWLERFPTARRGAQDVKPIDNVERALVELMKYATKLSCAEDSSNRIACTPRQMDRIFRALHRRRLIQPFGGLKAIPETKFEITPETIEKARGLYIWQENDWFHVQTGEALTNFKPESIIEELRRDEEV